MPDKIFSKVNWSAEILIELSEINQMFDSDYLHSENSFNIVERDGTYSDDIRYGYGAEIHVIAKLKKKYASGSTLLIKNLENWNSAIQRRIVELGGNGDVHLYLTPKSGTAFGFHQDRCDVYIHMIDGSKTFFFLDDENQETHVTIKTGECLFIPKGLLHRAESNLERSIHLSFGMWKKDTSIKLSFPFLGSGIEFV